MADTALSNDHRSSTGEVAVRHSLHRAYLVSRSLSDSIIPKYPRLINVSAICRTRFWVSMRNISFIRDALVNHQLLDTADSRSYVVRLVSIVLLAVVFFNTFFRKDQKLKAPFVGYRSLWEPTFLLKYRFFQGAAAIVAEGYDKFKDSMFWIRRNDTDILVISNKYVDELRALPDTKASPIQGHIRNLLGKHSTTDLLLESDLHTRVLQTRLTPNIGKLFGVIKEEHDLGMRIDLPHVTDEDFTELAVYDTLLRIIARISARLFVGLPLCRNEEWLAISIHYTENVFTTVMTLRMLPRFLHPIIVWFLPSSYRIHHNLRRAKKLILPLIGERLKAQHLGSPGSEKPNDMLQWMMDAANEDERKPYKIAHRQLVLTLGAIHTTTMAATHALLDLYAYPEYIAPLREEIGEVLSNAGGWDKTTLTKLRKMDSFLKESQRFNPPNIFSFNRVTMEPLTLSDGVYLPKGTHFVVPSASIMMDAAVVPNPREYDAFRWYRMRSEVRETRRHQYTMTTNSELHFGHGKFSCPGRFFAATEIKMILSHILLYYDSKYPEGKGRPINMVADDNIFPDPRAKLLIKVRANGRQILKEKYSRK